MNDIMKAYFLRLFSSVQIVPVKSMGCTFNQRHLMSSEDAVKEKTSPDFSLRGTGKIGTHCVFSQQRYTSTSFIYVLEPLVSITTDELSAPSSKPVGSSAGQIQDPLISLFFL